MQQRRYPDTRIEFQEDSARVLVSCRLGSDMGDTIYKVRGMFSPYCYNVCRSRNSPRTGICNHHGCSHPIAPLSTSTLSDLVTKGSNQASASHAIIVFSSCHSKRTDQQLLLYRPLCTADFSERGNPTTLSPPVLIISQDVDRGGVTIDNDEPSPSAGTHASLGNPAGGERREHNEKARDKESDVFRPQLRERRGGVDGQAAPEGEHWRMRHAVCIFFLSGMDCYFFSLGK